MQRAVFLDRDGVLITATHLVTRPEEIELENGAAEAVKKLNSFGFKVIVVTNQPQVARGLVTENEVRQINESIQKKLAEQGARIDAFYFCPHHPEMHADIPEWAKKYRTDCECRKPKPGMLLTAAKENNIDLDRSFMVGDRTVDTAAGRAAGCRTILVKTGLAGSDKKHDVHPDFVCENLADTAELIETNITVKAVILAGGRGERLKPITDTIPKPLIDVAGKPVLQYQIEALKRSGITDIVLCASYLVDKIKNYFGSGENLGVSISYPEEPSRLGSGGAVRNAASFLKGAERFVIINGDKMIGEFDFARMLDYDEKKKGFLTILARETDHPLDSDIIRLDGRNRVVEVVGRGQEVYRTSNSGIVIARPSLLAHIPEGVSSIEKDVTFRLIGKKEIYAFVMPSDWYVKDMGTMERLEAVRDHFKMIS